MRKWSRLTADLHLRQIASPLAPLTTQCPTLSIGSLTSNHLPTNNSPSGLRIVTEFDRTSLPG